MQPSSQPQPPSTASPAPATPASVLNTGSLPTVADDGDSIEKEWVGQVKQLVSRNANNPYELNQQFSKLKADYMQKRYGKTIKLDE